MFLQQVTSSQELRLTYSASLNTHICSKVSDTMLDIVDEYYIISLCFSEMFLLKHRFWEAASGSHQRALLFSKTSPGCRVFLQCLVFIELVRLIFTKKNLFFLSEGGTWSPWDPYHQLCLHTFPKQISDIFPLIPKEQAELENVSVGWIDRWDVWDQFQITFTFFL